MTCRVKIQGGGSELYECELVDCGGTASSPRVVDKEQ